MSAETLIISFSLHQSFAALFHRDAPYWTLTTMTKYESKITINNDLF